MILIIIKFCKLLLRISPRIINSLRSYIKHWKECFFLFPNTSKLGRKTRLRLVFPTYFSVFGNRRKHSPRVWSITWIRSCICLLAYRRQKFWVPLTSQAASYMAFFFFFFLTYQPSSIFRRFSRAKLTSRPSSCWLGFERCYFQFDLFACLSFLLE